MMKNEIIYPNLKCDAVGNATEVKLLAVEIEDLISLKKIAQPKRRPSDADERKRYFTI